MLFACSDFRRKTFRAKVLAKASNFSGADGEIVIADLSRQKLYLLFQLVSVCFCFGDALFELRIIKVNETFFDRSIQV